MSRISHLLAGHVNLSSPSIENPSVRMDRAGLQGMLGNYGEQPIRSLTSEWGRQAVQRLAELAEGEWKREAEKARQAARAQGLDQAAIDRAVQKIRYPS